MARFSHGQILPALPLYTPKLYCVTWSTVIGFGGRWGNIHSLLYMDYDGYHEGQLNLEELVIAKFHTQLFELDEYGKIVIFAEEK